MSKLSDSFSTYRFMVVLSIFLGLSILLVYSCNRQPQNSDASKKDTIVKTEATLKHPDWAYDKNIYEVNLRQYSKSGSFKDFETHLPRLKQMGVDILWFMPINPIGEKNRKGSLGSYYAIKDYKAVNPEHGTIDEFKALVQKAHASGMYVIIDWVANHTSWDNAWATEHPDWFTKDAKGNFMPPVPDWADVIDLNYDNRDMRKAMTEAMEFWVREADIDGFRCDVAFEVPTDFWDSTRMVLDKIKPVFMLAEAEKAELHNKAFDASYTWHLHHLMNGIAQGKENVHVLDKYFFPAPGTKQNHFADNDSVAFPANAMRMVFTSNHDENSWNGTEYERMGDGVKAFSVFTFTAPGIPLVYTGQEAGLNRRLKFFDKDVVEWKDHEMTAFYTIGLKLKKDNPALFSGEKGGSMTRIKTSNDEALFAYTRQKDSNVVITILNLTNKAQKTELELSAGEYNDVFANKAVTVKGKESMELPAWGYQVLVKK